MKLLDLFCGAGGAGMGYSRAGFEVVGVDINPQPRYPFAFHQGDALAFLKAHGHEFDAIHASPPCQAHTALKTMYNARTHVDLIPSVRRALKRTGKQWVIENVPGAPLFHSILLCGSMFALQTTDGSAELRRHRLFEATFPFHAPTGCQHYGPVLGVYSGHARDRRRTIGVYGGGDSRDFRRFPVGTIPVPKVFNVADCREAMGIDWMSIGSLSQAIPPAYTEFIGRALALSLVRLKAAA